MLISISRFYLISPFITFYFIAMVPKKKNPGFVTNVMYKNESLHFSPSYERLKDFLILIYELVEEVPLNLKRIEHRLQKNCHTNIFLEVRILYIYDYIIHN